MGAIALVERDMKRGRKIVELLDKNSFPVTAALWVYYQEIDRWTLLIATPRFKPGKKEDVGKKEYVEEAMQALLDLSSIIREAGEDEYEPESGHIKLVTVDDPTIRAFENEMGPVDKVQGVRRQWTRVESKNVSEMIEDALVYRTAA